MVKMINYSYISTLMNITIRKIGRFFTNILRLLIIVDQIIEFRT